jgi:anti-sigma factor RsiW
MIEFPESIVRVEILSKDEPRNREKSRVARVRQQVIGRELRRIFDAVVREPVPDEFMDLLKKMDAATKNPSTMVSN